MVQDNCSPKTKRLIADGRGQGLGKDYQPWTKTHEYSSKGRATRILGIKTGRIHHLQSDNQYRAFLTFEYCGKVVDIRETYPLLDVLEVIDDKDDLRFDKFQDKETKELYVITTNFVLTVREPNGTEKYVARTIKNTSELKRKITIEKLEIERRYWSQKGIDWKVITEKQLPRQLAKNIEWVRETLLEGSEEELNKEKLSIMLLKHLLENDEQSIIELLKLFERAEGLKKGSALFLFRYLLAKKELKIDMSKVIDLSTSVRNLIL
ncbi:TnsA endonuclease N-terminal domain-containing protein [Neobacillus citreus]|uniref:Heteromeric transposase endonuclease subunit TnsA n=1 Tax=Neobacillus citreus TaxID=2833578 RepID=A0A942T7G6_9BACI|nr:TnsA endonuclease N-terminal domain-containing protein [Neobacillus citreus]MCH6265102.1 TnsA endonuclease N-terminal domain-containing protein [Neobacillus citreus]